MPLWPDEAGKTAQQCLVGLAVLALTIANISGFAYVWAAGAVPTLQSGLTGALDIASWWFIQTFFTGKASILLAAMLGAWLASLDPAGAEAGGVPVGGRQWSLMSWLCLAGLLHGFLFWYGDQAFLFALAGMIAATASRMRLVSQLLLGGALVLVTLFMLWGGSALGALAGDSLSPAQMFGLSPERLAEIEATWRGGFLARLPGNMALELQHQLVALVFLGAGVVGVQILGMAAHKSGFLSGRLAPMVYAVTGAVCLGIGLPLCGWAALYALQTGFAATTAWKGAGSQLFGSVFVVAGYMSFIVLGVQQSVLPRVLGWLTLAGEAWLSLYFAQTLALAIVFFGIPGLSLFGRVSWGGLLAIAIVLLALQLVAVRFWFRAFTHGPVEWLWLRLASRQSIPLRRRAA